MDENGLVASIGATCWLLAYVAQPACSWFCNAAGGGFTNVDPESRRIVPDAKGRTKIKVVYVVLESQYQSSLSAAVRNINEKRKEVSFAAELTL
jgi:hypothetical protein